MSVLSILSTGLSALQANQQALRATSNNVANVNTVGYNRLETQFVSRQSQGGLFGVEVDIQRIANAYLAAAENRAASDVAAADAQAHFADRAQELFGDPTTGNDIFSSADPSFTAFGALSVDPASALRQANAVSELETLLSRVGQTSSELVGLRQETQSRLISAVQEANTLLSGIARLNRSIQSVAQGGGAAAEAQTEQQQLIDRLSELVDVRAQPRALGGFDIRTGDGFLLADTETGSLGFLPLVNGEPYAGISLVAPRATTPVPLDSHLAGGEIKGLLRARDAEVPRLQLAFGEYAAGLADAINAAHNQGTANPPLATLTGHNTGLLLEDVHGFTGSLNIGFVSTAAAPNDGLVTRNYRVDFGSPDTIITSDAGTVITTPGTIQGLRDGLNAAFGGSGAATFQNGALQISSNVAGTGVVIAEDPAAPARRAGRGFSETFGLNNLVTWPTPLNPSTGLQPTSAHGFTGGQQITFALRNADGAIFQRTTVQVVGGETLADLTTAINTALTGVARFSLDPATGRGTLAPLSNEVGSIDVLQDTTLRGDTGISFTELFILGEGHPADRANGLTLRQDIRANPGRLATAQADLAGAAVGTRVLFPGDGSNATALEAAATTRRSFAAAGVLTAETTSVSDYGSRLAGHVALRSEALVSAKTSSEAIREEVRNRRQGEEGVNLDEELVKLTTYQQAYAAASRLIQAARDLYTVLLEIV